MVGEGLYDPEEDFFASAAAATYVPQNPSLILDTSLWRAVSPSGAAQHSHSVGAGNLQVQLGNCGDGQRDEGRIESSGPSLISLQTVSAQNYEEEVLLAKFPSENGTTR